MPPSLTKINDELIRELTGLSIQVADVLRQVRDRDSEVESSLKNLQLELRDINNSIEMLNGQLQGGKDGPLLTRISLVEEKIMQLREFDKTTQQHHTNALTTQSSIEVAKVSGQWQLRVAIVTGILGGLSGLIVTLVQLFK